MTNIKGMEPYVAPAVKTTQPQKDPVVKQSEKRDSFESQLKDVVKSATGKDELPDEEVKETKEQEKLPIDGIPLTDITVPILTDDGSDTDLLRSITERSAAVVVTGYSEAISETSIHQQPMSVAGEEVNNIQIDADAQLKTDAVVKELTGQRDATVTKTDISGFGMQQVGTKQSGISQTEAKQTQAPDTNQINGQQADTKTVQQSDMKQTDMNQPDTSQSDAKQSGMQQPIQERQGQSARTSGSMNPLAEKSAEIPQPQTQLQQQGAGKAQNDSAVNPHMEGVTVTGQTEQPVDTKKLGEPTEVFQDVSAVKQNRLEPETPVRIKVAEPYKTLDTDAVKQLAAKISEGAAKGNKELIIQLTPENLGKISIKIAMEADGVKVVLSCENQKTLNLLSDKATGISHIVENNLNQHAVVEIKEDGYWNQQKDATDQHSGQQDRQQEEENKGNGQQDDMDNFIQQMRLGMRTSELAV